MQWLKQAQTRLEPHFNRALLLSILACLVILLTYLFGGAGAFVALRQRLFPTTASSVVKTGTPSTSGSTSGAGTTSSKSGVPNSAASPAVASSLAVALQVSPLDLPLNCALGAVASSAVTLSNPDSAAHSFALSWNGASSSTNGFSASLLAGSIPAHATQSVTISVLPLSLDPTTDSQYLWVRDDIAGASKVVAKVHVTCSILPGGTPALPLPTPTLPLP